MTRWLTIACVLLLPFSAHAAERAYLGVELLSITPELRQHYGANDDRGVLLSRLDEKGPAAEAGLKVGDVIETLNGRDINRFSDAVILIQSLRPGEDLEVAYVRDGKRRTKTVALAGREGVTRIQVGPFRWKGPTPLIDERALEKSMEHLQERLRGIDGRKAIILERQRRGLEDRIRSLEGKIAELEKRLGEQT